jgi:hypothetical protein
VKKPAKKAKPAKTTKRDPQLAVWAAQVEERLNALGAAKTDHETETDRLDTEVKRTHTRTSNLERAFSDLQGAMRNAASLLVGGKRGTRVFHADDGRGEILMVSRGVALVDWDNGHTSGRALTDLRPVADSEPK